jgi:hypothetical protein
MLDPQRHDRVLDPRLEPQEGGHQRDRGGRRHEHVARAPAVSGRADDRVDAGHQRHGDERRAEPVDPVMQPQWVRVLGDEGASECQRGEPDRNVDEEDPVPVERLREHAAEQQSERAAGDGDEHVGAHRPRALGRLRELGDDDREDDRRLERRADALQEPRADQDRLAPGRPAQDRGDGEDGDAEQEHALAADEVTESAGEQQQAAERDEEGVDDPGEITLGEMEVALDRRQGDVHDRRVEHDHELREADDHEGHPPAAIRAWREEGSHVRLHLIGETY